MMKRLDYRKMASIDGNVIPDVFLGLTTEDNYERDVAASRGYVRDKYPGQHFDIGATTVSEGIALTVRMCDG